MSYSKKELHQLHPWRELHACNSCDRAFSQSHNLKAHMKSHVEKLSFACKLCQTPFSGLASLQTHEKIHTGQMQYNCLQCNSSFESRHEQISHNRSEHKMWKCQTRRCNLRFQSLSSFTEHLTLRYECILCKKTFRFQSHFNYHVYIHNNPPKCYICSQNFATYKQLELLLTFIQASVR